MRFIIGILLVVAGPLQAETIFAGSKITAVTVYPQGAKLTRLVTFSAPAGAHDVVVADLPQDTIAQNLRLVPSGGLQIGAVALRTDRVPPREVVKSDAQIAAEAALEAAVAASTTAQLALDGVTARVDAAQAQIAYLNRLGAGDAKADTAVLQATVQMIGAEALAASQAALVARADLPAAQKLLKTAQEAQDKAQAALDAISVVAKDHAALSMAVSVATAGPVSVEVTQYMTQASWMPLYDIALDRAAGKVVIDRSLLVSQTTGEDWSGVALTLSTAQPGNRPEPSELWPELHRVDDPAPQLYAREAADAAGGLVAPMMEPAVVAAPYGKMAAQFQGDIVSYPYPNPVTIADGADNLRLTLDQISLPAVAQARAIPRNDATAYMMAEFTNSSGQIFLPGPAVLMRDGALIGDTALGSIAPGAKVTLGFGAIEGLRLKRIIPARAEGDRGLFAKSNRIEETAVLSVENLTAEDWAVRVMDVIPHSEQEELIITYTANPPATDQNVDDKRGVLAWNLKVPAGKTQEITLSTVESWPEGKELNGGRF
jgi:uncharacterized protein (TIGR02231 family)